MKHKKILNNNRITANSEFDVLPLLPMSDMSNRLLRKEMTACLYEYYLVDEIGEPSDYIDLCDALRSATPNDEFIIRINSGGGRLATADMIINAIQETQAHVHGFIESSCASAATFIYLACDSYSFSDGAEMMIHTSSSLYGGKEHEQYSYVMFSRKKIHKMMRERYAGFLTEQELDNVLNGQDYYFSAEDLEQRLTSYSEYQKKLFEEEMEAFAKEQEKALEEAFEKPKKKKQLLN